MAEQEQCELQKLVREARLQLTVARSHSVVQAPPHLKTASVKDSKLPIPSAPEKEEIEWSKKIERFIGDASVQAMDLPCSLSANERRFLHSLASKYNLGHQSKGLGRERHLVLMKDELFYRNKNVSALREPREKVHVEGYQDDHCERQYQKFKDALDPLSAACPSDVPPTTSQDATAWSHFTHVQVDLPVKKNVAERCTTCGTTQPVEYDSSKWTCCGYCSTCRCQTIWVLEEQTRKRNRNEEGGVAKEDMSADELEAVLRDVCNLDEDDIKTAVHFFANLGCRASKNIQFPICLADADLSALGKTPFVIRVAPGSLSSLQQVFVPPLAEHVHLVVPSDAREEGIFVYASQGIKSEATWQSFADAAKRNSQVSFCE